MRTLEHLSAALESGAVTSRELTERCLDAARAGEGPRAFISLDAGVMVAADAADAQRKAGMHPSRFAGIPISVKDLFDLRGQVTRAGSKVTRTASVWPVSPVQVSS